MAAARHLQIVHTPAWAEVLDLEAQSPRVIDPRRPRDVELAQVHGLVEFVRDSLPAAYGWGIRERGAYLLALKLLGKASA